MKRKRMFVRALALFMVGLITALALVIPTSALMTEYPTIDNFTTYECVMPFNVNFVGTDGTIDYVYSVPVGFNSPSEQTGINGHDTLTGRVLGSDGVTTNNATLEYYYYPTEWRIDYSGTELNDGWGCVPVKLNIDNTELNGKTIVIEAPTFYVNPLVSNWYDASRPETYNKWGVGAFRMPTLDDPTTQAYVGRYTVSANVVDDVGTKHPVSYSRTFDTRVNNNWIPMLEPSIFQEYVINDIQETGYNRIVAVTDFKAYVDYDYYEYVEPVTEDALAGIWVANSGWTATAGYGVYHFDGSIATGDGAYSFTKDNEHAGLAIGYTTDDVDFPGNTRANYIQYDIFYDIPNSVGYTLVVDNTLADVTNGDALLAWLQANATKQGATASASTAIEGTWELVSDSPLKATGIDVSYPVYERDFETDDLNLAYPDFYRYISKFRGIGNVDVNADFTGWIATATSGFLNFELLPNFSIGGVLAILVGFSLVILFLKIFAGG